MNRHIPKDVEQLMWLIAESGDSNAAQEFERRFPDFRFELMRRMSTVKSLKASKPSQKSVPVPAFHMHPKGATSNKSRGFFVGAFALGLGVLAFGSFAITQQLTKPKTPPAVIVETAPKQAVVNTPKQGVPQYPPGVSPQPSNGARLNGPAAGNPQGTDLAGVPPLSSEEKQALAPYLKPHNLKAEDATLSDVIDMICLTCGLEVEVMANPTMGHKIDYAAKITVDFRGQSGLDMLKALGSKHGFIPIHGGGKLFQLFPDSSFRPLVNPGE